MRTSEKNNRGIIRKLKEALKPMAKCLLTSVASEFYPEKSRLKA